MSDAPSHHPYLLRVGDKVRICADPVYPSSEIEGPYPIGTTGEIVGFAIHSICRTNTRRRQPPGIYLDPNWPFVRFDAGVVCNIRAAHLEVIDDEEYSKRLLQSLKEHKHPFYLKMVRVSDLPDTEIWEGDIVRVKYPKEKPGNIKPDSIPGLPDAYMVAHVWYRKPGDIIESPKDGPYFGIGDRFLQHWEGNLLSCNLELIERGNFWRRAHGQSLAFKDLEEETFWAWLNGETEAVPAPARPNQWWWSPDNHLHRIPQEAIDEDLAKWHDEAAALACIDEGRGHGLQTHCVEDPDFSNEYHVWHNVLHFKDEDLGRRVAAATKDGFRIPSRNWDKK